MSEQALVCYFYHAAFTVSFKKTLLIFSYRQSDQPQLPESLRLSESDFQGFNNILVFVPEASVVHHDPAIYQWKQSFPLTYIMPQEAAKTAPRAANVRISRAGDSFTVGYAQVSAFDAGTGGLSYLVKAEGITVFHAGDMNLWHWREENTLRDIARAEQQFYDLVSKLPKDSIDLCFFPLDPNQGGFYDAGANHLIMTLRPRVFFPSHFGERNEVALEYARRGISRRTIVSALTQVRESALVDFSGTSPQVRSTSPTTREGRRFGRQVDLNAYIHEDPFSQTDLPVDLKEREGS